MQISLHCYEKLITKTFRIYISLIQKIPILMINSFKKNFKGFMYM